MKIKFLGAANTVTGSCFVVETAANRFAVDCGMHQGGAETEKRNWDVAAYDPAHIDFFLITHAHIDHSGLLPRLVAHGFRGPVYATEPTGELLKILLLDSAHIQEMEAAWKNKKMRRNGKSSNCQPLYTEKDAQAVFPLIQTHNYDEPFIPVAGVQVKFKDAGHILGAAIAEILIEENGQRSKLVFSGDIGRPDQLLMKDPSSVCEADFLFMESTYGNRNHKGEKDSLNELAEAINYSYSRGEKVIIPAFAVERTQEILYSLHLLAQAGQLPQNMPVYLDSPLAIRATEIFRRYSSWLDGETQLLFKQGQDPLALPQLKFSLTTEQSIQINELPEPAIVISASGMADAGRIKHHLRHNLWREGASIVFVGFQAEGTTGRRIIDGAGKIRIFNEDIAIKAKIFTINGFSAHAGQSQLIDWLGNFCNKRMQVFLVHGESSAQETLAALIKEKYGLAVAIPRYLEEIQLIPGEKIAPLALPVHDVTPVRLTATLDNLTAKIDDIKNMRRKIQQLPEARQAEMLELLQETERSLNEIQANL